LSLSFRSVLTAVCQIGSHCRRAKTADPKFRSALCALYRIAPITFREYSSGRNAARADDRSLRDIGCDQSLHNIANQESPSFPRGNECVRETRPKETTNDFRCALGFENLCGHLPFAARRAFQRNNRGRWVDREQRSAFARCEQIPPALRRRNPPRRGL